MYEVSKHSQNFDSLESSQRLNQLLNELSDIVDEIRYNYKSDLMEYPYRLIERVSDEVSDMQDLAICQANNVAKRIIQNNV